jgi:hypothetical protein
MSLVKGRQCSEACLELLSLELVRAYGRQSRVPPAAAVDAIGAPSNAGPAWQGCDVYQEDACCAVLKSKVVR